MQDEVAAIAPAKPTSRFAEVNGLKLHYLDWGGDSSRHTVVMLHGGAAHAHWWDHVAPRLTTYGRIIALDARGHGRSQWAARYGPTAYVSDIHAFIGEHLRTRVVLVGHSMGGENAQRVAVAHPELLEALVVIDAPHGRPTLWRRISWRLNRRHPRGPRPEFQSLNDLERKFRLSPPGHNVSPDALKALALKGAEQLPNGNWVFRFDPKTRQSRRTWSENRKPRLAKIPIPVMIIRGEHSTLVSRRQITRMHRRIHGATVREIPRAYHHVPLDNPDDTVAAISEFLETIEDGGSHPRQPFSKIDA